MLVLLDQISFLENTAADMFFGQTNDLGFKLKRQIDPAFREFKKLADKKKEIFDTDIEE